jgi:hypothetical protein
MKKRKNFIFKLKAISIMLMVLASMLNISVFNMPVNQAQAATNLISGASFEDNMTSNWNLWKNVASTREYEFFRSYDTPFGNGTYSGAIEAKGNGEDRWFAGLSNTKKFNVESAAKYYVSFEAKASSNQTISLFLQNASTYDAITNVADEMITTEWKKYIVPLTPNASTLATFTFSFGDIRAGNIINIDSVQVFKSSLNLTTSQIAGFIGESNKTINITNIGNFNAEDIEVELPYYNNQTLQQTTKRFHPENVVANSISIKMYEQTFAGVAKVYVDNEKIGEFTYQVNPKANDIYPSMVRADEDLTITGSGFHPGLNSDNTYMILKVVDINGKISDTWVKPHIIDTKLSQVTAKVPFGVVKGTVFVHTSFLDKDFNTVKVKSNALNYSVKPMVSKLEWSKRGFEQVGDNIKITGKGISDNPYVNFYDNAGKRVETIKAKVIEIYNKEVIEVATTKKVNYLNITVTAGGIESDNSAPLSYLAKPILTSVNTKYSRQIISSTEKVPAAKVGDTITLSGAGFLYDTSTTTVEFQGMNTRVYANVDPAKISKDGKSLTVTVPAGALNGFMNVIVNRERSNALPIEIIPVITKIAPNPIVPGESMWINANGIGSQIGLVKVFVTLSKGEVIEIQPTSLENYATESVIHLKAPLALSSEYSAINVQYDRWKDDGSAILNTRPQITSASINTDTNILSIKGYGFSLYSKENVITYKYADQNRTVITPNVKVLGVYPTEEGQEIRIKIIDNYHYGYVSVTVGTFASNEANFGPASISKISRRVEYVASENAVRGVLYINGYNFGTSGGVMVGSHWATVHYRTEYLIIAVIDQQYVNDNPVIVTRN